MPDLKARLAGAALLVGSGASTFVHRVVFEATRGGPAGLAEFALGLFTFMLASVGSVLLIQGSRLFERSVRWQPVRAMRPRWPTSAFAAIWTARVSGWAVHRLRNILKRQAIQKRRQRLNKVNASVNSHIRQ